VGKKNIVNRIPIDDWLAAYVHDHAFDTLTPTERMQFRMACAQGTDTVSRWVDATLPKYKPLWQRLKSAQRQRRFRQTSARGLWTEDWRVAELNFGRAIVDDLRRLQARLTATDPTGRYETPRDVLNAAMGALAEKLDAVEKRPPRGAGPHTREGESGQSTTRRSV
jgi:hypothetical protein